MIYLIDENIDAWRTISNDFGVQWTTARWEKFTTTKETTYTDADRIQQPQYPDAQHYYYFRLPESALPYRTFIVWKSDAHCYPSPEDIAQGYMKGLTE